MPTLPLSLWSGCLLLKTKFKINTTCLQSSNISIVFKIRNWSRNAWDWRQNVWQLTSICSKYLMEIFGSKHLVLNQETIFFWNIGTCSSDLCWPLHFPDKVFPCWYLLLHQTHQDRSVNYMYCTSLRQFCQSWVFTKTVVLKSDINMNRTQNKVL
jgi:hypothetical protein